MKKRTAKPPPAVADRLDRIEDLLIEMRAVLDMHYKRIGKLQAQLDVLSEKE
jgi:hypothetical protein